MDKLILILFLLFPLISLVVTAQLQVGSEDSEIGINLVPEVPVNVSSYNVTSSDYWGSYLWSDYNMPTILSFAYNQTSSTFNSWGEFWYNQTLGTLNDASLTFLNLSGTNANQNLDITGFNLSMDIGKFGNSTDWVWVGAFPVGGGPQLQFQTSSGFIGPAIATVGFLGPDFYVGTTSSGSSLQLVAGTGNSIALVSPLETGTNQIKSSSYTTRFGNSINVLSGNYLTMGDSANSKIGYDGTNLQLTSTAVGSGFINITGDVVFNNLIQSNLDMNTTNVTGTDWMFFANSSGANKMRMGPLGGVNGYGIQALDDEGVWKNVLYLTSSNNLVLEAGGSGGNAGDFYLYSPAHMIVKSYKAIGLNKVSPGALFHGVSRATDWPLMILEGIAGQTEEIFYARDVEGNNLTTVGPTGNLTVLGNVTGDWGYFNNLNVSRDISIDGNFTGNQFYGEMWNKSDTGFAIVDLIAQDVYVQILNISGLSLLNGFTYSDSNLTAVDGGIYKVSAVASLSAGGNSEFGLKVFQNSTGQDECYSHSNIATGDAQALSIACFLKLEGGDTIGLYVDDHTNPPNDPTVHSANVNLVRIGNL